MLRLPSGTLAQNQGTFTRQIKRITGLRVLSYIARSSAFSLYAISYFNNVWIRLVCIHVYVCVRAREKIVLFARVKRVSERNAKPLRAALCVY